MSYSERKEKRFKILQFIAILFIIFIFQMLIRSYLLTTYRIQADTMQPVFASNDMIVTSPFSFDKTDLERGTIVVVEPFKATNLPLIKKCINDLMLFITFQLYSPFSSEQPAHVKPFIRRIVGIPGDTIYMDAFTVHIKTKNSRHFLTEFEIINNPYNIKIDTLPERWSTDLPFSGTYPQITLKENEYFVLCDNRIASGDSRLWGPVKIGTHIKSCVLMRYWPLSRLSFF